MPSSDAIPRLQLNTLKTHPLPDGDTQVKSARVIPSTKVAPSNSPTSISLDGGEERHKQRELEELRTSQLRQSQRHLIQVESNDDNGNLSFSTIESDDDNQGSPRSATSSITDDETPRTPTGNKTKENAPSTPDVVITVSAEPITPEHTSRPSSSTQYCNWLRSVLRL